MTGEAAPTRRSLEWAWSGWPAKLGRLPIIPNPACVPATHGPRPERVARALGPLGVRRAQMGEHKAAGTDQGNGPQRALPQDKGFPFVHHTWHQQLEKGCEGQTRTVRAPTAPRCRHTRSRELCRFTPRAGHGGASDVAGSAKGRDGGTSRGDDAQQRILKGQLMLRLPDSPRKSNLDSSKFQRGP